MKKYLICILCIALILVGCESGKRVGKNGEVVVPLKVYLVSPKAVGEKEYRYTDYALGEFMSIQTAYGEESYIYKTMLEEYQQNNPVEFEIEYFDFSEDLDAQLVEDMEKGKLPDLIIQNTISGNDTYALIESGMVLDISSYVAEDNLYESEEYFNEVLEAGRFEGKQYVMPLSFNMNTLMSSEETLNRHNLNFSNMSIEEVLTQLTGRAIMMQRDDREEELLAQFVSPLGDFPITILMSAAGGNFINYEEKKVELDQELYNLIAEFYKQYAILEMGDEEAVRQHGSQLGLYGSIHDKRMGAAVRFDAIHESTVAFIEGGSCYNTFIHSFAAQANYYESQYTDIKETFCLFGIPTYEDNLKYRPMVTSYGAVLADSEYPKEAYEFLKYMMDQPYFEHYDLSVNRAATEKMLDQLTRTTYNIKQMNGYFDVPDLELETDYLMKPLTETTENQILNMLDNMEEATLNNWPVYYKIQSNMLKYVIGEASLEESYQNCLKELNEYVNTFTFEGQLQDGINFDY